MITSNARTERTKRRSTGCVWRGRAMIALEIAAVKMLIGKGHKCTKKM